jgi:hypothetical protein
MGAKLLISEEEKIHIKKLYGLLTEAVEPYTQSQKVTFESGYYGEQYAAPFLDPLIENIKKYLLDRPGERFVVNVAISSGESRIPNTDNEGAIKGKGKPLLPKALAIQRGITIRDYLNEKLGELVKTGVLPSLPQYTIADPKIGATPWVGTEFCPEGSSESEQRGGCKTRYNACCGKGMKNASKYYDNYQKEQYLDMSITITEEAKTTTEECSDTIRIRFEVSNHSCQNAEFFVFANKTRLNNMEGGLTANLNTGTADRGIPDVRSQPIFPKELMNPGYGILTKKYKEGIKGKTKEEADALFSKAVRYDDFEIPLANKEAILSQSITKKGDTPFMNIWFECTTADAHDDIVKITVYDGNNKIIVQPFSPKGKNQGLLCTLDKCGKPIQTSDGRVGPGDIDSARQELISYKSNLMSKLGLTADTSNLDTKGLELEKAGNILANINVIVKQFDEVYPLIKSSFDKNTKPWNNTDSKTKESIMSQASTFNFVRKEKNDEYFKKVFDSTGYKSLLRKDPLDSNSYRRGLITSDMGGDLKVRLDTFYKYFNLFYRINDDGYISLIPLTTPEKYIDVNQKLKKIREKT